MNLIKYTTILTFGLLSQVSPVFAQKKLANDIYTYNYAGIINKNNGKAIAKTADYPNQRVLAFSHSQVENNQLAFEAYSELFSKYGDKVDAFDKLCFALAARKVENYLLSDSLLIVLKSTEYGDKPFFPELNSEFAAQNAGAETYWPENDFSEFYMLKPFNSNTGLGEYALVPDKKGNAYYSTHIEKGLKKSVSLWHEQPYYQIYKARYSDSFLGQGKEITNNKSVAHQHVSFVDPNTGFIYVTRNAKKKNAKRERVLQVFAMRQNPVTKKWTEIPFQLNNADYSVADLIISPDGTKVVFASDMPNGFGKSDLYEAPIIQNDEKGIKIGDVKNMGAEINTVLRDNFPSYSDSGQFYFSSDGHLGFGGLDIFFVDAATGAIINAGKPINSNYDDFGAQIHDRDAWGTITSNRSSKGVDDNLYFFRWVGPTEEEMEAEKPSPVIVEIVDAETGLPLKGAEVALDNLNDAEIGIKGVTDEKGMFTFSDISAEESNPNLQVTSHPCGYRYATADSVVDLPDGGRKIVLKAKAYKIDDDLGKLFDIKPIYYASAKFEITEESKVELDKLVVIMQDNPGLSVELGSHTDSRASVVYNQKLSEDRALAAYKYVVNRGVAVDRIGYKGFGESKLINKCADGVTCSDDMHAQNRRTEYIIRAVVPCNDKPVTIEPTAVDSAAPAVKASDAALSDISQTNMICGDADADGIPDYLDTDSDNDGLPDASEGRGDVDKDGFPNFLDRDSDGDGIADGIEKTGDVDKDGKANYLDTDSDGDGIEDKIEGVKDFDKDGQADYLDTDSDNDGIADKLETADDLDKDGVANYRDLDSDGDGINDNVEGKLDIDHDGKPNFLDLDSDGDSIPDAMEKGKSNNPVDTDSDGKPDYLDTDSDEDGLPDRVEAPACLPGQKMDNAPVSTNTNNNISNIYPAPSKVLTTPAPPVSVVKPTQGVKVEYRIQFVISKQQMDKKAFETKGIGAVYEYKQGEYYKYCTAKVFNSEAEAAAEKARVRALGYADAFIAGFQNGVRVK